MTDIAPDIHNLSANIIDKHNQTTVIETRVQDTKKNGIMHDKALSKEEFMKLSNIQLNQISQVFIESLSKLNVEKVQEAIKNLVSTYNIVLFMKGDNDFPACGFSSRVVDLLERLKVPFVGINILDSEQVRSGVKVFSNWPTVPQLYVDGNFIGGCDIIIEMHKSGKLKDLLEGYIN